MEPDKLKRGNELDAIIKHCTKTIDTLDMSEKGTPIIKVTKMTGSDIPVKIETHSTVYEIVGVNVGEHELDFPRELFDEVKAAIKKYKEKLMERRDNFQDEFNKL